MTTLLYVDDEVTIGRVVSRFFSRRGDVALLAHNIAEAQQHILAGAEPDAIFIDVWIGSESGFELIDWIHDTFPYLTERVTFVTGEDIGGDPDRLSRTLGRPVIQKPFDLTRLAESIESAGRRAET